MAEPPELAGPNATRDRAGHPPDAGDDHESRGSERGGRDDEGRESPPEHETPGSLIGYVTNSAFSGCVDAARARDGVDRIEMLRMVQPAGEYPDEPFSFYGVHLIISGDAWARCDVGVGEFSTSAGRSEFVLVPPNTSATFEIDDTIGLSVLGVPTRFVDAAAASLGTLRPDVEVLLSAVHRDPLVELMMQACWDEMHTGHRRDDLMIDSILLGLASRLVALTRSAGGAARPSTSGSRETLGPAQLERLAGYVDSGIDPGLRIATLARLVDMNEHAFARAFRAATGSSPYRWVLDRRVDRARGLLATSALGIADIAYATGFASQAHLTTVFRERLGTTPGAYRRDRRG